MDAKQTQPTTTTNEEKKEEAKSNETKASADQQPVAETK